MRKKRKEKKGEIKRDKDECVWRREKKKKKKQRPRAGERPERMTALLE